MAKINNPITDPENPIKPKRGRPKKVVTPQEPVTATPEEVVSPDVDESIIDNMAEVAEAFGGEDALEMIEEYCAPDQSWTPEIVRKSKLKGKEITEKITVIPTREAMRIATDNFMSMQKYRVGLENQIRSTDQGYDTRSDHEIGILDMFLEDAITSEANAKTILESVTMSNPICCWMRENFGIGPILAAELYAYFDFSRAKYASGFISYAGLNNNNRPRLSKEKAAKIVDDVCGDADGDAITDDMLMEIATITKWPIEYITRKATKEVKVKSMCRKSRLITCVELLLDDTDQVVDRSEISKFINNTIPAPSATKEDLDNVAAHFNIPTNKLFDLAVSKSVKEKLAGDGGSRSKELIRKAITVFPYNKTLKMIVWKMSTSFVYQSSNPKCFYGKLYKQRLQYELQKNEAGEYAEQAAQILASKNFGKTTEAYKCYSEGKLPKAHITARAMRWAAKVFINHLYEAMWVYYHQSLDYPKYYAVSQLGHYDIIEPDVPYDMLLNKNLPEHQRNLNPLPIITEK